VFGLLHTLPPCKDVRALKMPSRILVWDLETIPDLRGFASITIKLKRGTFPATVFLACLAALEFDGVALEEI
jgi:hypothetical protein